MASQNIKNTSDQQFDSEIIKSDSLTLVDFWAEWCGPCKMLAPTLDALADEYGAKIKVFKLNVDENPDTPPKFKILGIPTVVFFKNGQVVDQLVGNQPKDAFKQAIARHL